MKSRIIQLVPNSVYKSPVSLSPFHIDKIDYMGVAGMHRVGLGAYEHNLGLF